MSKRISRRHFFFGTLLAGVIPRGGFGVAASLKALGYKSPNEKLNIAGIGAGGRAMSDPARAPRVENIVALADVDWARGRKAFKRFQKAAKYKDFRQMLDKEGKNIDAVIVGHPRSHARHLRPGLHAARQACVCREAADPPRRGRRASSPQAAEKYKVATQMGNQGYSHEATRVACEILWSGEIGDVKEVHAWTGGERRKRWPPGQCPTRSTALARRHCPASPDTPRLEPRGCGGRGAARAAPRSGSADGVPAVARGGSQQNFGFYLPFNWRGFYDFGSSLIGDWGVHHPRSCELGPAGSEVRLSVECIKQKNSLPASPSPMSGRSEYEFAERRGMPPVSIYWYHHAGGDAYLPPGMPVDEVARKIPGPGPQVGAGGRTWWGRPRVRWRAPAAALPPGLRPVRTAPRRRAVLAGGSQGSGYNTVFVGSKGYLGTSGRGEGVGLLPGSRWAEYKLPPATAGALASDIRATGCVPARAASPPAPISALRGPTPNGWCSAPRPFTSKAS